MAIITRKNVSAYCQNIICAHAEHTYLKFHLKVQFYVAIPQSIFVQNVHYVLEISSSFRAFAFSSYVGIAYVGLF